mgnify:FL=1
MDFNPEGTKMSLMYYSGDLVVSDVDDDACIFYFDTKQSKACNLNFTPLNGIQCDHWKIGIAELGGIQYLAAQF